MRLKDDLVLRHIGEDYIIVEPGQDQIDLSKVYTLNETAAWLWEQLKGKDFSLEEVVAALLDQYEVDQETAEQDAAALLALFREQKLLA
ncbi:PqqD family protein [Sphingobacterium oryzagri]|uniref:PqqD family protein n=1 Tax=Sphingobacterium oryzagri TaxID=3025669 RepID=A0ABY7WFE2_9SPHI|nr:PqqD family protein [Sphingobacterium sp. KACC 22765]WDF68343.1 PqqD family protein [Sphingobacterium sp. KACC 22765]